MNKLRIAVIGGGHLGKFHARLARQVEAFELVAIVETDEAARQAIVDEFHVAAVADYRQIVDQIDAAIIAVPTSSHHQIGCHLLSRGIHLLIEKPLAMNQRQAADLVEAARARNAVLQVGHVERFNPAFQALRKHITHNSPAVYLEAVREGTLTFRSMDIGVVLDLMIHDLDLILSLVPSAVQRVEATGFHWTGVQEDIAEARLTFANGCVAQLTASRISPTPRRTMRVFADNWQAAVDYSSQVTEVIHRGTYADSHFHDVAIEERRERQANLFETAFPRVTLEGTPNNAILEEQRDFANSIETRSAPQVTGHDGLAAISVAEEIISQITRRQTLPHTQPHSLPATSPTAWPATTRRAS